MGPRRVGKTVIIHHAIQRLLAEGVPPRTLCYISVDHPIYNGLGLEGMLESYSEASGIDFRQTECLIAFDEIQYLRDWEIHLKALVDRYDNLRFVASGSAAAVLRLKSVESGAGRMTDLLLPPLTFHEFLVLRNREDLVEIATQGEGRPTFHFPDGVALNDAFIEYLNYGGYPEVVMSPAIRSDPGRYIKSDIIDKVLLRDLPSLYGISDIQELNSLFTTLAYNTAGEVSLEGLFKNSGVAKNTIKRYIEYLEAAFLLKVVHRVDRDGTRFKRANHFKVYLTNPSIRCALFSAVGIDDESIGSLVETAVFAQFFHAEYALHYARWPRGEVDMVHLGPNQKPAWAIEVKWSDRGEHDETMSDNLLGFCERHAIRRAVMTTRTTRFDRRRGSVVLEARPASELSFVVGYNLVREKADPGSFFFA